MENSSNQDSYNLIKICEPWTRDSALKMLDIEMRLIEIHDFTVCLIVALTNLCIAVLPVYPPH